MILPNVLTLLLVILAARLCGDLFRRLGQPSVMGEVLGGLLLGPSLFGRLAPEFSAAVFHPEALTFLKDVSQIGIVLYLFMLGLEIDLPRLRRSARSAVVVSQFSVWLPFSLGLLLASQIYESHAPSGLGFWAFAGFTGVALSITAFPVLARILSESKLHQTSLGELALTCAAIDDITAWCLVAVVTGLLASSMTGAVLTVVLTLFYILLMVQVVRPLIARILPAIEKKSERLSQTLMAIAVLGALASAALTDLIGIHAFFGAFLFGAVIPHNSLIAREVTGRLQDVVAVLFLPAFFVLTGLKTDLGLLSKSAQWGLCAVILALAIAGKWGGAYLGARLSRHAHREASLLGILMNTRGLVELIVLNLGLQLGIFTPLLFTMFVLMAVVTTFMTGPLLRGVLK